MFVGADVSRWIDDIAQTDGGACPIARGGLRVLGSWLVCLMRGGPDRDHTDDGRRHLGDHDGDRVRIGPGMSNPHGEQGQRHLHQRHVQKNGQSLPPRYHDHTDKAAHERAP
jgi:hypothetical protein